MDHFNATVFNGSMVATRRGFQVTKQKHGDISFVNASVEDLGRSSSKSSSKGRSTAAPQQQTRFTFVNGNDDATPGAPRRRVNRSRSPSHSAIRRPTTPARRLARGNQRNRRQSSSSVSSSSPASSPAILAWHVDDSALNAANGPPVVAESADRYLHQLPTWASYKLSADARESQRRLAFMCLAFSAMNFYPPPAAGSGDGAPAQDVESCIAGIRDATAVHCGMTLGALFDAVRSGQRTTPKLESLTSQLFSIINRRLKIQEPSNSVSDITIHAVATLAIIAGYLGRHDHWHVHMTGLLNLLDMVGGQHNLETMTVNTIRKADISGALSDASQPRVPFVRRHVPVRCPTSLIDQAYANESLMRHLTVCGLDYEVANAIVDAAEFNKALEIAADGKSAFTVDGEVALEQCMNLEYRLLSHPIPLKEVNDLAPSDDPESKAIESAVRVLTLLYIRKPTFDLPCGVDMLLEILEQQVENIRTTWRSRSTQNPHMDPALIQDANAALRPTLIWICLAGHVLSSRNLKKGVAIGDLAKPTPYKELLREVVGPMVTTDPGLLTDEDLEVCQLLNLTHIRGQNWHPREAITHMLNFVKLE